MEGFVTIGFVIIAFFLLSKYPKYKIPSAVNRPPYLYFILILIGGLGLSLAAPIAGLLFSLGGVGVLYLVKSTLKINSKRYVGLYLMSIFTYILLASSLMNNLMELKILDFLGVEVEVTEFEPEFVKTRDQTGGTEYDLEHRVEYKAEDNLAQAFIDYGVHLKIVLFLVLLYFYHSGLSRIGAKKGVSV